MSGARHDPDSEKEWLDIERQKLELERGRATREQRFLNRHFGTVLTVVVSLMAAFVSASQVYLSYRGERERRLIERGDKDRDWNLRLVEFVSEHKDTIFGGDDEQRVRIRNVILVAFPPSLTTALFAKLEEASKPTTEGTTLWKDSQDKAANISAAQISPEVSRFYLHYQDPADAQLVDRITAALVANGYPVPTRKLVTQKTQGDMRYFHEEDRSTVEGAKGIVEAELAKDGRETALDVIYLGDRPLFRDVPPGLIEIWIARRST